ncbi:hypothetical protein ABIA35_007617 [Catenulispora sp. MAP12-49]|uniref:hypothetical protein n=1 Tax=Catenulispora sp. MAP12-49 TaxID=3156302 RepID=UPI00351517FA
MTEDRSQTSNEPVSETSAAAWRADRLSGPLGITVDPPGERRPAPVLTAAEAAVWADRAAGALIGAACGDALGVPYESGRPFGEDEVPVMLGGGLGPYAPG